MSRTAELASDPPPAHSEATEARRSLSVPAPREQPTAYRMTIDVYDRIVAGGIRDYKGRHATAAEVGLLIEVADSSLRFDSRSKMEAYAGAGIPVYWVVNLPRRRIDVYSRPSGPGPSPSYADQRGHAPGETVPVVLDGREVGRIAVDDVLP